VGKSKTTRRREQDGPHEQTFIVSRALIKGASVGLINRRCSRMTKSWESNGKYGRVYLTVIVCRTVWRLSPKYYKALVSGIQARESGRYNTQRRGGNSNRDY